MVEGRTMQNAHMDVGARVKQEARADAYTDESGRATQDAVAEQSAIRHKRHKHPGKLKE